MAFNASFTITKSPTLGVLIITDTSTGSDSNLTGRTVNVLRSDGTNYVPPITNWAIGTTFTTLPVLAKDVALNIVVTWATSVVLPSPSTYTYSSILAYTEFGEQFYYSLTQKLSARPVIISDSDYYENVFMLRTEIDSASNAIVYGNDQFSSQGCIDRYNFLIDNEATFF